MASHDEGELHNVLLAIHSRLTTIEGKLNMVARAEKDKILSALEDVVAADPLVAQVYLLLDGRRTQKDLRAELERYGISTSQATLSRRMSDLVSEYGVAEQVDRGLLRKNRSADEILNLTRRMTEWLGRSSSPVPLEQKKKPRKEQT